jgi:hypothetical protein
MHRRQIGVRCIKKLSEKVAKKFRLDCMKIEDCFLHEDKRIKYAGVSRRHYLHQETAAIQRLFSFKRERFLMMKKGFEML